MTPVIRLAQPADLAQLDRMCRALWPDVDEADKEHFMRVLQGEGIGGQPSAFFVAEFAGVLAGFAEVGLRSYVDGCDPARPTGYLEGWFVDDAHRGKGWGAQLVRAAEEWARAQGCREFGSDTWIDNEGSQRAHEALGFEVVDRCVHYRKSL
jgi:aminoglycoside 6'-N-acetyltransferase I